MNTLSRRLRVLAPAAALALFSTFARADGFAFKDTPGDHLDVLHDGKIIASYMYGHDVSTPDLRIEHYKPFLHVFDAEGQAPITKGAGGTLTHHRGIFLGWNKMTVDGKNYDRWSMGGGDQVHEQFTNQSAGPASATFTSHVRWQGGKPEETLIDEERTFTFLPGQGSIYAVIDTESKIKAVLGDTTLNADPEHSGLHYRPADKILRQFTAYLYPKADANPHKDHDYPWFAETYTLGDKQYSVVMLNPPTNKPGTVISAYRDYGRFGETWSDTLKKDEMRDIRARFLIAAGDLPSAEVIQQAWNEYAGKTEPVPQTTRKNAEKTSFADPNNPKPTDNKPKAEAKPKTEKPAAQ